MFEVIQVERAFAVINGPEMELNSQRGERLPSPSRPPPHSPISNLHSHLTTYTLLSKSFYVARSDIPVRQLTALASESEGHRFKYHLGRLSVQWPCSNYLSSPNLLLCLENGGNQIQFTELLQIIKLNNMVKGLTAVSDIYIYMITIFDNISNIV